MNGRLSATFRQEAEAQGNETILDVATGRVEELPYLEKRLHELEKAGDVSSPEYLETHAKHDKLNDPEVETKAKKMLRGLGFRDTDFDRKATEMSGGWIMRARLSRLLVMEPDLLLLDEPTNHLDLLSLLWLQNYLKNYSGALLLISHDRQFMDEVITQVHEISEKKLIAYTGNYSDYLEQTRTTLRTATSRLQKSAEGNLRLQAFADRFRSIPSKASQAQSKLKQIERLELIEKPMAPRKPFRFQIPPPPRGGQRAISLEGIHMAYGTHQVYKGLDLSIDTRRTHCARWPKWRGQIYVAENSRGCRRVPKRKNVISVTMPRSATSASIALTRLDPEKNVLEEVLASAPQMREDEAARCAWLVHVP